MGQIKFKEFLEMDCLVSNVFINPLFMSFPIHKFIRAVTLRRVNYELCKLCKLTNSPESDYEVVQTKQCEIIGNVAIHRDSPVSHKNSVVFFQQFAGMFLSL